MEKRFSEFGTIVASSAASHIVPNVELSFSIFPASSLRIFSNKVRGGWLAAHWGWVGGALAFMANRTETRPRQGGNAVDRSAVLRKVMEVLSAKGFAKASIADLTSAAGLGYGALHKAFGTRDEILRAAIRFCADTEASLAHEPLRVSPTGREAILAMLEENVRLRRHWPRYCGCLFTFNAFIVPPEDDRPAGLPSREASFSFEAHPLAACAIREGRRTS